MEVEDFDPEKTPAHEWMMTEEEKEVWTFIADGIWQMVPEVATAITKYLDDPRCRGLKLLCLDGRMTLCPIYERIIPEQISEMIKPPGRHV